MLLFTIRFIIIAFLFYFIHRASSDETAPMVKTPLGVIAGSYATSYSGRKYEVYQSIPYAIPPIGKLRFQPPQPVSKWDDILYSNTKPRICIQLKANSKEIIGEEDCLYLNIYVPIHNRKRLLPVLFSIHGGAFRYGYAVTNVTYMMDRDVILVSINYRLGIIGFLSTEDDHIPGNMGLKDQSMALRWTFENIESFGGNPIKITLHGVSAGARSVHFHYLSPLSKGLFQNGISFSGTSLGPGSIHKRSLEKFQKIVVILKCPNINISESIECLQEKPAKEVVKAVQYFEVSFLCPLISFGPVVEKGGEKPFIDRSPIDIISSGDVADVLWINGFVSHEGILPGGIYIDNDTKIKELDERWFSIAPHLLMYNFTIPVEKHDHYSSLIRNRYFGNEKITKSNVQKIIALLGNGIQYSSGNKAAKLQAKVNKNPVLVWYYSYRAFRSVIEHYTTETKNYGVCHGDDFHLIYGTSNFNLMKWKEDRATQMKLMDMLTSLATEGYPDLGQNVSWERVNPNTEKLEVLNFISSNDIKMELQDNCDEYKFWDVIIDYEKQD